MEKLPQADALTQELRAPTRGVNSPTYLRDLKVLPSGPLHKQFSDTEPY